MTHCQNLSTISKLIKLSITLMFSPFTSQNPSMMILWYSNQGLKLAILDDPFISMSMSTIWFWGQMRHLRATHNGIIFQLLIPEKTRSTHSMFSTSRNLIVSTIVVFKYWSIVTKWQIKRTLDGIEMVIMFVIIKVISRRRIPDIIIPWLGASSSNMILIPFSSLIAIHILTAGWLVSWQPWRNKKIGNK